MTGFPGTGRGNPQQVPPFTVIEGQVHGPSPQNTWFHISEFAAGKSATYNLKKNGNGIYAFILEEEVQQLS